MSHPETSTWQEALSSLVTDPKELLTLLELDPALLEAAQAAACVFPLKTPRGFVARMQKGNPDDPLLRQVLPLGMELAESAGYVQDPLQENQANPVPGLLHKYHGRVLVTLTSACAVHCRYCFRRHFPYEANNPGRSGWVRIADYIAADPSVTEVILSGGDPLAVSDRLLYQFTDLIGAVKHVRRLRIHSRLPVVLPERITDSFIEWISQPRFETSLVIHANHPQELSQDVIKAMQDIHKAGVHVLNQSVLLRGVNDQADILAALSEQLYSAGVLPYYLHLLDKVQGSAHFEVSLERARSIYAELCNKLPGYLVPKLACEEPGAASKTLLAIPSL